MVTNHVLLDLQVSFAKRWRSGAARRAKARLGSVRFLPCRGAAAVIAIAAEQCGDGPQVPGEVRCDHTRVHGQATHCRALRVRALRGGGGTVRRIGRTCVTCRSCKCVLIVPAARRRMASLSLYKDIESAEGEITDDRLSLRECGIEGGPGMETPVRRFQGRPIGQGAADNLCMPLERLLLPFTPSHPSLPQPVFTMFFDYRPFAFDEPVLLAEHRPARDSGRAAAGASSGPASPSRAGP